MKKSKKSAGTEASLGHNSTSGEGKERLKSFIKRLETLDMNKAAINEDIAEVYAEAKGTGYDVPTIRKIITLKKMDEDKRREQQELLDLYRHAIGFED